MFLFCVDGTHGSFFGTEAYDADMGNSFVNQIFRTANCGPEHRVYFRGPDPTGKLRAPNPRYLAWLIKNTVFGAAEPSGPVLYQAGSSPLGPPPEDIFLVGYSRGAGIVINAASVLGDVWKIPVKGLFLFDAVSRSLEIDAERIPTNVEYCYHAMRDPKSKSRRSFGNCGTQGRFYDDGQPSTFPTTHAGMGGVPWGKNGLKSREWFLEQAAKLATPDVGDGLGMSFPNPQLQTLYFEQMYAENKDKIYEGAPDWDFTAMTVERERKGMYQVREYMWKRLRDRGVVQ
jgi:hypothetical protein